jgi:hypothetical protein
MKDGQRRDKTTLIIGTAAICLIVFTVLEALSFVALSATRRQWFTYGRLQNDRAAVVRGSEPPVPIARQRPQLPGFIVNEVVHPYLGFVLDRSFPRCQKDLAGYRDVLDYGFSCSDVPLVQKRTPDTVIIGLFGGSVAYAFPALGFAPLREELLKAPSYAGKKIVLVPLALPGFKQPQQLLTLTYFLMLGAEFDILINLDGFNDLVLPAVENIPKGVFPFFPRSWFFRTAALDPTTIARMGEVAYLRDRRSVHAAFFSRAPLCYSATASFLWALLDRLDVAQAARVQARLLQSSGEGGSFVQKGPDRSYASETEMYADLAAGWQRSSLQMHHLAQANGAVYFHFLQPNQYVPDSKPVGDEERRQALQDTFGFRHSVEVGYPHLRAEGHDLRSRGVRFHDMVLAFANEPRPIYVDDCCHFDVTGYQILARAMASAIIDDIGATAP